MKTSESINDLAAAFAKAQGEMSAATKDAKGNFGRYATLAAVWDVIRAPLSANQLAVMQCPEAVEGGVSVQLRVVHSSGQWLETELRVPVNKADAQGVGSAISYASRYQLRTVFGIPSDDDDDGQAAVKAAPKQAQQAQPVRPQQTRPAPPVTPKPEPVPTSSQPAQPESTGITKAQTEHITSLRTAILATRKMVDTDWRPFLAFALQDDTLTDANSRVNRVQAEAFIARFGTIGPDKALVLDIKAFEACLSDWDDALERARAANLPAVTGDQVLEETQVTLEAQPASTGQKDFDGLGA